MLSDAQWERIAPELSGKVGDPGSSGRDNRLFIEAVLWIARTGSPWRDLPEAFGKWFTVYTRFWRWAQKGRLGARFQGSLRRSRFRICPHRRHTRPGPPAWHRRKRGTQNQAVGRSRGGLTTKIMALIDALGNLVRFVLLPGQRHDSIGIEPLITGLDFEALIGDKAFDNNWLRANLNERGAAAVIPSKADRARRIPHDAEMYKWRHLIENFFCRLKAFRRIATRYEKTDACFAAVINLVAAFLAIR